MSTVQQAKEWLEAESPSTEEIRQAIENTCYLLAQPCSAERKADLNAVINLLVDRHPEPKPEIIRPETPSQGQIDCSPLLPADDNAQPPISPQERRRLFDLVKAEGFGV